MIASNIGSTFLKAYNKRFNTDYNAKGFFEEVYIPLFFDRPKYMRTGGNAPLENPKIRKGTFPDEEERAERIAKTITKIEEDPEGSSPIGYPSSGLDATTSGQVSSLRLEITPEDVYLSWIGGGLGVGVGGGLSLYFNRPDILMKIYDGWQFYRDYLEEIEHLKGNQIDTWNGQWLTHAYSKFFDEQQPKQNLDPFETKKDGIMQLTTQSWVRLLFSLTTAFPDERLLAYVFSLGQQNETVGFIPLALPKVRYLQDLYVELFGENQYLKDAKKMEEIYAYKNNFKRACERGGIGFMALEPKALRDIVYNKKPIKYKPKDEAQVVSFRTFKTWLLAMLNNKELHALSQRVAQTFIDYEQTADRAKSTKSREVEKLMSTNSLNAFLKDLLAIVEGASPESALTLRELLVQVNELSEANFKRFLLLLKLEYAIVKKQNT